MIIDDIASGVNDNDCDNHWGWGQKIDLPTHVIQFTHYNVIIQYFQAVLPHSRKKIECEQANIKANHDNQENNNNKEADDHKENNNKEAHNNNINNKKNNYS